MSDAETSIRIALENIKTEPSRLAAYAIMIDCRDRKGIKHEFEQLDEDVLVEIIETWQEIIRRCYKGTSLHDNL